VDLSSRLGPNGFGGLEMLSEDSSFVFRRGRRDSAEGGRNAVLVVFPAPEQPDSATLDRLAHEHSLKEEPDSTWVARLLELAPDRGRTVLSLDDPDGLLVIAGTLACAAAEQTGANTSAEWPEEAVIKIVNQLDRSVGVVTSGEEWKQLAELKSRD
jgi:hypothetical protein